MQIIRPNQKILNSIEENLVSLPLGNIYNSLIGSFDDDFKSRGEGFYSFSKDCLKISDEDYFSEGVIGLDVPLIIKGIGNKRVMFLAQDPLRNEDDFINTLGVCNDKIVLGTPFAVHSKYYRTRGKGKFYTELFFSMAQEFNQIYLTDVYKLWKKDGVGRRKGRDISLGLLKDEISIFQPDIVLAFGTEAYNTLVKLNLGVTICRTPHQNAWPKAWRDFGLKKLDDTSKINIILNELKKNKK